MVRLLLTVFFVGLVVSCACWGAVAAMGGPDNHGWANFTRHNNGRWTFSDDGDGSASSNETTTRDLAWTGGDRLEIDVPAKVDYTQGPAAKVTLSGPKDLIDRIELHDGVIDYPRTVGWVGRNGRHATVYITVQAPGVKRFELNGANEMAINGYAQDSMDLEVNGAAKVSASGQANRLHMELNGASSAEMGSLTNDDADVELNGASNVTMGPRLSARVEINGVGHAHMLTHPANMQHETNGIGSITYDTDSTTPAQPLKPLPAPGAAQPAPPAPPAKPRAKTSAT